MRKPRVFISVGHGGRDPGAVANGLKEKYVNLAVALACKAELERHDVDVMLSRTTDKDSSLEERIRQCNAFAPDLAIEIHHNAGGGDGVEVFYHYKGGTSKELAQNVLDAIVAAGQNSRGIKVKLNEQGRDYFGFIRQTVAPAVIVEGAFLDNKKDVQFIDTAQEQAAEGVAIAKGALKTLKLEWKPEETYTVTVCGLGKASADKLAALAAEMEATGCSVKLEKR